MTYLVNPSDGVRIAFDIEGTGPPLVLFHGSVSSSAMWRHTGYVDALKDRFRLILIDARGHGKSDRPRDQRSYQMRCFVSDVIAVLDTLGIEQAHYFGYSFGGRVAFGLGTTAPERFESMIIGGGAYHAPPGSFDRVTFPGALETIEQEGIVAFLDGWSAHLGAPLPDDLRATFLDNDPRSLVPYLRQMEQDESLVGSLTRMTMPVLLFVGERDHERLEASRLAASLLPHAELVFIHGETHASMLLRSDKMLPLISSFLQRVALLSPAARA
jgi:pimeloyl-ACP methyl ester carboxylesterase